MSDAEAVYTIAIGDMRAQLAALPDESVDAVVTDPPYGLSSQPDMVEVLRAWLAGEEYTHTAAGGFMGKSWDSFVPGPDYWREVYRVMKPGAHLVAFGGSRTYDLLALALRLAHFEIRDTLAWLYGTGFPKSIDVSREIDRRRDWSLLKPLQGKIKAARLAKGLTQHACALACGATVEGAPWGGGYMWFETGMRIPTPEQYYKLKALLDLDDECDAAFQAAEREVTGEHTSATPGLVGRRFTDGDRMRRDKPATEAGAQWQGWGTGLKPAFEPIVLARKPLRETTIAGQVMASGTGALNLDATRVGSELLPEQVKGQALVGTFNQVNPMITPARVGRWPANLLLSHTPDCAPVGQVDDLDAPGVAWECAPDCPVAELDRQSGVLHARGNRTPTKRRQSSGAWSLNGSTLGVGPDGPIDPGDTGGASRYFSTFHYSGKASRAEREAGLDELPSYSPAETTGSAQDSTRLHSPRTGAGRTRDVRNVHPTVKPLDLMRWVLRLVAPPGALIVDPFAGSGSTGVAAILEGMRPWLCELDPDHQFAGIIRGRLEHALRQRPLILPPPPKATTPTPAAAAAPAPARRPRRQVYNGPTLWESTA
jgi:DNA modification methylase/transcriptional regulator with XRE-family HTH domain